MKLKLFKYLALALALVMALALMVSCTPEGNTDESSAVQTEAVVTVPYNIAEYVVIRPEQTVEEVIYSGVTLRKHLNSLLGDSVVKITDDWIKGGVITEEVTAAKEILIGSL